ncbi:MAG: hypothetical protein LUE90_06265 [Clostridiales bacterium]|nr:hypothetical protein [Clostridiales bacterium]
MTNEGATEKRCCSISLFKRKIEYIPITNRSDFLKKSCGFLRPFSKDALRRIAKAAKKYQAEGSHCPDFSA